MHKNNIRRINQNLNNNKVVYLGWGKWADGAQVLERDFSLYNYLHI